VLAGEGEAALLEAEQLALLVMAISPSIRARGAPEQWWIASSESKPVSEAELSPTEPVAGKKGTATR
jgi:hypothetical protein